MAIVEQYDRLTDPRERGALLRREGLYQSQIREWRAERDAKAAGLVPPRNSHRASPRSSVSETDQLRAENARLTKELAKSQAVVEIMGKLQGLLETISESTDTLPPPTKP